MNQVGDFYDAIDRFAPFENAEKWDNAGLLMGGRTRPVSRALLALDLTGAVLEEAKRLRAELVITHHPVILEPIGRLDGDGIVYRAAAAGLSVICAHTNLDMAKGGVNDALAVRLGLGRVRPFVEARQIPYKKVAVHVPMGAVQEVYEAMAGAGAGTEGKYSHCAFLARGEGRFLPMEGAQPAIGEVGVLETVEETRLEMLCSPVKLPEVLAALHKAHPYEQPSYDVLDNHAAGYRLSMGRIGDLPLPLQPGELAVMAKERLGAAGVRYIDGGKEISTVAVLGGSGGGFLAQAKQLGAQALVTGEVKHHHLLEAAELGLTLVDAGHFATENVVMEPLRLELSKRLPGAVITLSGNCTDGAKYIV